MNQENHQTPYENDRITDQELYQRMNNSDFFSFTRFEEQPFYCPTTESFYPFYPSNVNSTLALYPSQFLYPQYPQNYPLSQTASSYPLFGSAFFSPSIDHIPEYQKNYCHTRASYEEDSKVSVGICNGSKSKIEKNNYLVKEQSLKIEEKELTIKASFQGGAESNTFEKKHFNSQSSLSEFVDSITRKERVNRYLLKKQRRTFEKRIVYQCRKSVADNRVRVKGRFVKRNRYEVENKSCEMKQNEEQ